MTTLAIIKQHVLNGGDEEGAERVFVDRFAIGDKRNNKNVKISYSSRRGWGDSRAGSEYPSNSIGSGITSR